MVRQGVVKEGPDYAVSYVTWDEAVEFCRKLSEREGVVYRLPTEAEWEYACRAGSVTAYIFGDNCYRPPGSGGGLDAYEWWRRNANNIGEKYPHRIGQELANAWGLYDMHGNVNEWCSDRWIEDYYRSSPSSDPRGPSTSRARVLRGGGWNSFSGFCGSAARNANPPEIRGWDTGFRVAAVRVDPK